MSTQKSNDFQFLDVGRVDPAKKDLDQRRDEFTEIYHPFRLRMLGRRHIDAFPAGIPIVLGNVRCITISPIG